MRQDECENPRCCNELPCSACMLCDGVTREEAALEARAPRYGWWPETRTGEERYSLTPRGRRVLQADAVSFSEGCE